MKDCFRATTFLNFLRQKSPFLSLAFVFLALAIWHLYTLLRFPSPFVDDVLTASRVFGMVHSGLPVGPIDGPPVNEIDGYWRSFPYLPILAYAVPSFLTNTITLFQLRSVSLVFGILLLFACYRIGRHYGGHLLGILSVILVGLSVAFVHGAHLARADIMGAAIAYFGLVLHLENIDKRPARSFLSGLLIGIAFEFHARSSLVAPVIGVLMLLQHRQRIVFSKTAWAFVLGGATGLLLYYLLHVVPNIDAFRETTALIYAERTPPLLTFHAPVLLHSFKESFLLMKVLYPLRSYLAAIGFAILLLFGKNGERRIAILSLILFISGTVFVDSKTMFKAFFYSPAIDFISAALLAKLISLARSSPSLRSFGLLSIVSGLFLAELIFSTYIPTKSGSPCLTDFEDVGTFIRANIPSSARVMGEETHWFHLRSQRYYTWKALRVYQRFSGLKSLADGFRYFKPDYFVIDGQISPFLHDNPVGDPFTDHLRISPTELFNFLDQHATLKASTPSRCYGEVRVFRFNAWIESQS